MLQSFDQKLVEQLLEGKKSPRFGRLQQQQGVGLMMRLTRIDKFMFDRVFYMQLLILAQSHGSHEAVTLLRAVVTSPQFHFVFLPNQSQEQKHQKQYRQFVIEVLNQLSKGILTARTVTEKYPIADHIFIRLIRSFLNLSGLIEHIEDEIDSVSHLNFISSYFNLPIKHEENGVRFPATGIYVKITSDTMELYRQSCVLDSIVEQSLSQVVQTPYSTTNKFDFGQIEKQFINQPMKLDQSMVEQFFQNASRLTKSNSFSIVCPLTTEINEQPQITNEVHHSKQSEEGVLEIPSKEVSRETRNTHSTISTQTEVQNTAAPQSSVELKSPQNKEYEIKQEVIEEKSSNESETANEEQTEEHKNKFIENNKVIYYPYKQAQSVKFSKSQSLQLKKKHVLNLNVTEQFTNSFVRSVMCQPHSNNVAFIRDRARKFRSQINPKLFGLNSK